MNNRQNFSTLESENSWSVFVEKWWQTLSVTLISAIIACCSVVWTLKVAANVSDEV